MSGAGDTTDEECWQPGPWELVSMEPCGTAMVPGIVNGFGQPTQMVPMMRCRHVYQRRLIRTWAEVRYETKVVVA